MLNTQVVSKGRDASCFPPVVRELRWLIPWSPPSYLYGQAAQTVIPSLFISISAALSSPDLIVRVVYLSLLPCLILMEEVARILLEL